MVRSAARSRPAVPLFHVKAKWTRFDRERQNPNVLAAVRQGPREGTLLDATADPNFISILLENLRVARITEADHRRIEFAPTAKFPKDPPIPTPPVPPAHPDPSHTT